MAHKKSSKRQKRSGRRATGTRPVIAAGPLPIARELLSAGVELDADVEMARQRRMEALKAKLTELIASGRGAQAVDQVITVMTELEREAERLAWRVLRANRFRFGRSTEKLSREELEQLLLAFGGAASSSESDPKVPAPVEPEQADDGSDSNESEEQTASQPSSEKPKKRRRVRSMTVAPTVQRNVTVSPIPEDERVCALCGRPKKIYGYVEHELIKFVPAHIELDIEQREKAGCEHCRKDVSVAPREQAPAVVRKVDASLLAKLISEKCSLGLPLDRQRRELQMLGLDVPEKTLQSYWAYATDLLEPVAVAALSEVFGKAIVGVDDTHLKTIDKASKHGVFRGHIWCFVGTDGVLGEHETVAYGYTPSWDATEITEWFSAIDGFIQCDGYAGYSTEVEDEQTGQTLVAVPSERRLGCGMHIRSKFHDALLAKDGRAAIPLKHFSDLYQIEADCKDRSLDADARAQERRRRSLPILAEFDSWVDEQHPKLLPKSPLRRATTYAINQRPFFQRCFQDGRFEIDNGRTERWIRPFAVARRGFLFTGSMRGGERLAAAFTLVDSCLILGIDPYRYLVDVINKLERGWRLRQLSELIPHRWAREQAGQNRAE
jgi:transposase